jgi:uncharacterized protein DUF5302
MTSSQSTPEEAEDESGGAAELPAEDETRRRFREALRLKQQRSHASATAAERDGSEKSHGANGPTKSRVFRRKSG